MYMYGIMSISYMSHVQHTYHKVIKNKSYSAGGERGQATCVVVINMNLRGGHYYKHTI